MISTNEFRTGLTIELDGNIFTVVDFMHVKPGKGAAFVRSKLKNVETGATIEKTFRAGERVQRAILDQRKMQYLYTDGDSYYFMDEETFEQMSISTDLLGDAVNYLKENMSLDVIMHEGRTIGVDMPNFVELEVTESEPGVKGDTASGGTKEAILETGAAVQVPFFIEVGDVIRIDTRTGEYMERA
ncbi:MAG: elongation factor P [Clostridia bacterium]|nr:elongation factor P [Clostridia bacterium]